MNVTETRELVTVIFATDGRELTNSAFESWFSAIGHLNVKVAKDAVKACIQEQTTRIMPAHVLAKAKEQLKDQAARRIEPAPSKSDPCPICVHDKLLIDCTFCQKTLAEESKCRHDKYPIYCEPCQPHFMRLSWMDWQKLKAVI